MDIEVRFTDDTTTRVSQVLPRDCPDCGGTPSQIWTWAELGKIPTYQGILPLMGLKPSSYAREVQRGKTPLDLDAWQQYSNAFLPWGRSIMSVKRAFPKSVDREVWTYTESILQTIDTQEWQRELWSEMPPASMFVESLVDICPMMLNLSNLSRVFRHVPDNPPGVCSIHYECPLPSIAPLSCEVTENGVLRIHSGDRVPLVIAAGQWISYRETL